MENGKMKFCKDLLGAGDYLTKLEKNNTIGVWGVHQDLNIAHHQVYNRVRAMSDHVVGIYYQNWASWINYICGGCQYTDAPYDSGIAHELEGMCDTVIIFSDDYNIFDGRYGFTLKDLWPQMLAQYPDHKLPRDIRTGEGRENLYSHFRACQALKIVFNTFVPCDVSAGGKRDAWRWDFKKWQAEYYDYSYQMLEPVLDQYGNSIAGSKKNLDIDIDFPLLIPDLSLDAARRRLDGYGIMVHYIFRLNGYLYGKFSHGDTYWVEAINDK